MQDEALSIWAILSFRLRSQWVCRTPVLTEGTDKPNYHYSDIMARWYGMDYSFLDSSHFPFLMMTSFIM